MSPHNGYRYVSREGSRVRIDQDSLYSRMKGKEKRDQFPAREAPNIPSLSEGGQREELLCRLLGGEYWQDLFARVREDVGQLQALSAARDYQIVLKRRVHF